MSKRQRADANGAAVADDGTEEGHSGGGHDEQGDQRPDDDQQHQVVWTETLANAVEAQRERQSEIVGKISALTLQGLAFLDHVKLKFEGDMQSLQAELCKLCEENEASWAHMATSTNELQGRLHNAQDLVARLGIDSREKGDGAPF